ncbi:hypothetical protein, partial [Bradyrhizobium ottawaense]|uniref:hypothetical protein n=2 Tax=Bradyrhizobium ottawaense TaxID=931866 RepID=UPI0030C6C637
TYLHERRETYGFSIVSATQDCLLAIFETFPRIVRDVLDAAQCAPKKQCRATIAPSDGAGWIQFDRVSKMSKGLRRTFRGVLIKAAEPTNEAIVRREVVGRSPPLTLYFRDTYFAIKRTNYPLSYCVLQIEHVRRKTIETISPDVGPRFRIIELARDP